MISPHQLRYLIQVPFVLPLLPILYWQGKQIQKKVPRLPEAQQPEGKVKGQNKKTLRVLGLGESTMAGVGVTTHQEGFMGSFAQAITVHTGMGVHWKVVAKSGIKTAGVIQRLLPKVKNDQPDIILICLGGNNAFALHSPHQWENDCLKLIAALQNQFGVETPIVFSNMPPIRYFPAFTPLIKQLIGRLVESYSAQLAGSVQKIPNVFFNDEVVRFDTWRKRYQTDATLEELFSDGVHPSPLTYQLWGQDMAAFVRATVLKVNQTV